MTAKKVDDSELVGEAVRWVERLSGRVDAATRQHFTDWIRASPKHSRYFLAQSAIDAMVREYATGAVHPADVVGALQGIDFGPPKMQRGPSRPDADSRHRVKVAGLTAAAILAVVGALSLRAWWQSLGWAEFNATADTPLKLSSDR